MRSLAFVFLALVAGCGESSKPTPLPTPPPETTPKPIQLQRSDPPAFPPLKVDVEPFDGSHWEGRFPGITITGDRTTWLKSQHRTLLVYVDLWHPAADERARVEDTARTVADYYGQMMFDRFGRDHIACTVTVYLHCPPKPGEKNRTYENGVGQVFWSKFGDTPRDCDVDWFD